MNELKISIITITYNSEKTVRTTFESVRNQHYPNLEYIVIDGGSRDSTLKIADEYKDIIAKIISEPDEGISDAMNKGIKIATGNLIGIIHSDDALVQGALEKLSAAWDGKTDVYYGDAIIMDKDGTPTHILCGKEDLSGLPYGFCLVHPATFVSKQAYEKYGLFDKKLKCAMDYELFLRFYKEKAIFKYMHENFAYFRSGGTNERYRQRTIDEVCEVSIRHGGSKMKAYALKYKKVVADKVRPLFGKIIRNKRVQELPNIARGGIILLKICLYRASIFPSVRYYKNAFEPEVEIL